MVETVLASSEFSRDATTVPSCRWAQRFHDITQQRNEVSLKRS